MALNPLRNIPSVSELLESEPLRRLVDRISRNAVVNAVRVALDELRTEVQTAASEKTMPNLSELSERIAQRIVQSQAPLMRPVINATGVVLHPQLGGAPLAEEAVAAMIAVGRDYASLDIDLATGRPAHRVAAVEQMLCELTGAEAAMVVGNHAGAVLLALAALAAGREAIVSRGQLAESGDGLRVPDLVAASGALLREVGSTNKTHPDDYARAVGSQTAALLLVHPGNYTITGFAESVGLPELVELGRRHKLPVVHDLGAGAMIDLARFGLAGMPVVAASVRGGADVVLLAGDGLLGGPPCGIILGRSGLVEKMKQHPLAAALRVDKLTLAALGATLPLYRDPEKALLAIPVLQMLSTSAENLKNRAQRLAAQLAAAGAVATAEPLAATTSLGGDCVPGQQLPTWCIALRGASLSAERLAATLRTGDPPVVGRVGDDRLLLDLRSVLPRHDMNLVAAVEAITPTPAEPSSEPDATDQPTTRGVV